MHAFRDQCARRRCCDCLDESLGDGTLRTFQDVSNKPLAFLQISCEAFRPVLPGFLVRQGSGFHLVAVFGIVCHPPAVSFARNAPQNGGVVVKMSRTIIKELRGRSLREAYDIPVVFLFLIKPFPCVKGLDRPSSKLHTSQYLPDLLTLVYKNYVTESSIATEST